MNVLEQWYQHEGIETCIGEHAINRIRVALGDGLPTAKALYAYRPAHAIFSDTHFATDPTNPHNEAHAARAQIIGSLLVRLRFPKRLVPTVERYVLTALKWDDVRQGRWANNGFHAAEAAELFYADEAEKERFTIAERHVIRYLIRNHSLKEIPPDLKGTPLGDLLHTVMDPDASDLSRQTLLQPVNHDKIILRTYEAQQYALPHVARRIEQVSGFIYSGDGYKDQLLAAQQLGLLQ